MDKPFEFVTDHLLTKWGFQDGEMLDDLFPDDDHEFVRWVLCEVVEYYVCSKIDNDVKPYRTKTSHNPVRVYEVDGVHEGDWTEPPRLTPFEIKVSPNEIFEMADYLRGLLALGWELDALRRSPRCVELFEA